MIETYGIPHKLDTPKVGRLSAYEDPSLASFSPVLLIERSCGPKALGKFSAFITDMSKKEWLDVGGSLHKPGLFSVDDISQFHHGDGLALMPEGKAILVYRPESNSNALFVTSQCNSNCIMCPQPPLKENAVDLTELAFQTLKVMDPEIELLGITGGEPTLLDDKLFLLIEMIKKKFPLATLHVLTNARYFSQTANAYKIALIEHPNILMGIPLCSDNPYDHDDITRIQGSFDQTVKGVINLASFGIPVEIRIVMVKQTVSRLTKLAEFIYRNLPFTSQVCFMGMEPIGYAKQNFSQLWIDPVEYQVALEEAVLYLSLRGIEVAIYNEQLCVLNRRLWKYARQAISDWKNIYIDACSDCMMQESCGGFFSSSEGKFHSRGIKRVSDNA